MEFVNLTAAAHSWARSNASGRPEENKKENDTISANFPSDCKMIPDLHYREPSIPRLLLANRTTFCSDYYLWMVAVALAPGQFGALGGQV